MTIRDYQPADAAAIIEIFSSAVHAIADTLYSPEQKSAWAPLPADERLWVRRLAAKQPLVAIVEGSLVGFLELEADGHIDCAYVHPKYQGQGIGGTLLNHALATATQRGLAGVYTEASKAALAFFAKHGFKLVSENEARRAGQVLVNYTMERSLLRPA